MPQHSTICANITNPGEPVRDPPLHVAVIGIRIEKGYRQRAVRVRTASWQNGSLRATLGCFLKTIRLVRALFFNCLCLLFRDGQALIAKGFLIRGL